jgi:hypothetical protein
MKGSWLTDADWVVLLRFASERRAKTHISVVAACSANSYPLLAYIVPKYNTIFNAMTLNPQGRTFCIPLLSCTARRMRAAQVAYSSLTASDLECFPKDT